MQVYLHRANGFANIYRANTLGVGVEVDIRTYHGLPLVSHDAIVEPDECEDLKQLLVALQSDLPVLLDFKETGILDIVKSYLPEQVLEKSLCIDLIAPDMFHAQEIGLYTLARHSKFETIIPSCRDSQFHAGFWLDYVFDHEDTYQWIGDKSYMFHLVSPELHGQELTDTYIKVAIVAGFGSVCTDYPERWLEAIG